MQILIFWIIDNNIYVFYNDKTMNAFRPDWIALCFSVLFMCAYAVSIGLLLHGVFF